MQNHLTLPTQFKADSSRPRFTGASAVFGNIDDGGDVILPGAIKEISRNRDGKVIILYQHRPDSPIALADVSITQSGLNVDAEFIAGDELAAKARRHMLAGALDSMSIGYNVMPGGEQFKNGIRELSAIKVIECSCVTWGMNPLAKIESVKSWADCKTNRELEDFLRDRCDIGARKAAAWAAAIRRCEEGHKNPATELEREIQRAIAIQIPQ